MVKKYEADFRIKYADKNPFIKENEEIGITDKHSWPTKATKANSLSTGKDKKSEPC